MERLKMTESVAVKQKKEWGEILTGFETKNKYAIVDSNDQQLYFAAEESSFLGRFFLKALRPFTVHILGSDGLEVFKAVKPFCFYFHEISVYTQDGRKTGTVKREFSILRKNFEVQDEHGQTLYKICAPILHPWTFNISKNGTEDGVIVKKWSGLAKEAFTDADNFGVKFPQNTTPEQKALFIGALFLIDMMYFDNR